MVEEAGKGDPFRWKTQRYGAGRSTRRVRPVDLLVPLSELTRFSPSQRGLLLPGFRRIGHRTVAGHRHSGNWASSTDGIFNPEPHPNNVHQKWIEESGRLGACRLPHDCRRVFASEHLNNDTPVHVIQALLGHATLDTVMVYAKLYPRKMIEEYRKAMRGVYSASMGKRALRSRLGKSGMRSPRAAACAIWELIFVRFRQASTASEDSSAWDAVMHNQKRVLSPSFKECLPVTSEN